MDTDTQTLRTACTFADVLALPCFVLSCHADGGIRFEHFNVAHIAAIGLPIESVRGRTPHECFPERVAETLLKNYATCRRTARAHEYEELLDLGGVEMWWQTTLSPILREDGTVSGIVGTAMDITARKARDFRRTEVESALRSLNDDLALFTSMTAHDVRGPLTKIASLTELTLDGFEDMGDNKLEMIESMRQVADGTLRHIDGILGYAAALRIGECEKAPIDFGHMCRDIAAVVDPEATMSIRSPEVVIDGEAVVLQMILRNLVENAMRHADSRLEIGVAEGEEGRLRFSVADDGAGFQGGAEAFRRKMGLRQVATGNRGFGLAAVAHLVESRGGATWLDAPVFETGATICFGLPGRIVWEEEVEPVKKKVAAA